MKSTTEPAYDFREPPTPSPVNGKAQERAPQAPKQDIPSFVQIVRILLWTTTQYLILLLPVARLCVTVAMGMLTGSTGNERNESQKPSGPDVK